MIQINNKVDCCGCGACRQICPKQCISMVEDKEGTPYPKVDIATCMNCKLCEKVCPIIHVKETTLPDDVLTYAAINKNHEQRASSSSGGVFQKIAEYTILQGGVVFGARFDDNWEVVHDKACTLEEIEPLKRSKYVQSDTCNTFSEAKEILKQGRLVTYVGTPCQIAGLRQFLCKEYENLICISLICHGVPSRGVWRRYIEEIKFRSERSAVDGKNTVLYPPKSKPIITNINFREKQNGGYRWQKYGFVVHIKSSSKGDKDSVFWSHYAWKEPFMLSFLRDYILRPSCFHCKFRNGSSHSDLIIADFWGIEHKCDDPDFASDKGTTWVIVTSAKGESFFENIDVKKLKFMFKDGKWANISIYVNPRKPKSSVIYHFLLRFFSVETTLKMTEPFNTIERWYIKKMRKFKTLVWNILKRLGLK